MLRPSNIASVGGLAPDQDRVEMLQDLPREKSGDVSQRTVLGDRVQISSSPGSNMIWKASVNQVRRFLLYRTPQVFNMLIQIMIHPMIGV